MGTFIRLVDYNSSFEKEKEFFYQNNHFIIKDQDDFSKIPGNPIAYWVSDSFRNTFEKYCPFSKYANCIQGIITGNTDVFLRLWFEVNFSKIAIGFSDINTIDLITQNWIPYTKGGDLRKWYGNNEYIINWKNKGRDLVRSRTKNASYYLRPCITWTLITSTFFSARYCPNGYLWDVSGSIGFPKPNQNIYYHLSLLCSNYSIYALKSINPTLNTNIENINAIPVLLLEETLKNIIVKNAEDAIRIAKSDWDNHEISWDFKKSPIIDEKFKMMAEQNTIDYGKISLSYIYGRLHVHWNEMIVEMKRLEEENNNIFIEAYDLKNEMGYEISSEEISLNCNPFYRYGSNKSKEELETIQIIDTMKEFISYAVGCMFGRYSSDGEGLIISNQGETINDFKEKIPNSTFLPDEDNIIPVLDDEYFEDDIITRFKEFLKTTFGPQTLYENLEFIAEAIGKRGNETAEQTIRRYFLNDFYVDHCKMYKKRPIYWLFTSGHEKAFNALIYMHRYNKETFAKMRIDYLIKFEEKLEAKKAALKTDSDDPKIKQRALNEQTKINKKLVEIRKYDEKLKHIADQYIEIDLDDGVKSNYKLFEEIIAKI